jgi:hypothetical protein
VISLSPEEGDVIKTAVLILDEMEERACVDVPDYARIIEVDTNAGEANEVEPGDGDA